MDFPLGSPSKKSVGGFACSGRFANFEFGVESWAVPPVIVSIDSWMPLFFDKDMLPGVDIRNFDGGTIIYAYVICGFGPKAEMVIFGIVVNVDSA
jgi:hypothetical protein